MIGLSRAPKKWEDMTSLEMKKCLDLRQYLDALPGEVCGNTVEGCCGRELKETREKQYQEKKKEERRMRKDKRAVS